MKKSQFKCKRRFVDWYQLLLDIGDFEQSQDFWALKQKHPSMSNNRVAYNVLKRYYSTTAIAYVRLNGGNLDALNGYFSKYDVVR